MKYPEWLLHLAEKIYDDVGDPGSVRDVCIDKICFLLYKDLTERLLMDKD